MNYSEFAGNINEKEEYINVLLNVGLKLVDQCGDFECFTPLNIYNSGKTDISTYSLTNNGVQTFYKLNTSLWSNIEDVFPEMKFLPSINYIKQSEVDMFSLGFTLLKVFLTGIEMNQPNLLEVASSEGVQFFINKLKNIQGIELTIEYIVETHLISIFLENVSNDDLDQLIFQIEALPFFAFLKTEFQKINPAAAEALFNTRHKFLTIDTCFYVIKSMLVTPQFSPEVKSLTYCKFLYEYNLPDLDVNELYIMPGLGSGRTWNKQCLRELIRNNFKTYVTFNERGTYTDVSEYERSLYNAQCTNNCEFHSIPIEDYTTPTESQITMFWEIVNQYNRRKVLEPEMKFVMHCTSGNGRSTWMLISYILMKMVQKDGTDVVLGPIIQALKVVYQICLETDGDDLFEKPFFLTEDNCPNALKRFSVEYTPEMATLYTLELLSLVVKNTPIMQHIREIIKRVNLHAVEEVFQHSSGEGTNLFLLFIKWIFLICQTILHNQAAAPEPVLKKKKTRVTD